MSERASILDKRDAGRAIRLGEAYLEFVERDDFVAHLRSRQERPEMRLEITVMWGKPQQYNLKTVSFYAVATARFAEHIAIFKHRLLITDNWKLEHERRTAQEARRESENEEREVGPEAEPTRLRMFSLFEQVKEWFTSAGIKVERGLWRYEAPTELLSEVVYE